MTPFQSPDDILAGALALCAEMANITADLARNPSLESSDRIAAASATARIAATTVPIALQLTALERDLMTDADTRLGSGVAQRLQHPRPFDAIREARARHLLTRKGAELDLAQEGMSK